MGGNGARPWPMLVLLALCTLMFTPLGLTAANNNKVFTTTTVRESMNDSMAFVVLNSVRRGGVGTTKVSLPFRTKAREIDFALREGRSSSSSGSGREPGAPAASPNPGDESPVAAADHAADRTAVGQQPSDKKAGDVGSRRRGFFGWRRKPVELPSGGGGGGRDGGGPPQRHNDRVGGGGAAGTLDAAAQLRSGPPVSAVQRIRQKIAKTRNNVEVGVERAIHVRREVKAAFSSDLERCLLKATRPDNTAVDEGRVQALLAQANRLSAVEANFDCDPHEVVCSKLHRKMMEGDWRTVAKAMCLMHHLQRDSPPKEARRFSAFMRDQWADGAGGLGNHIRMEGGRNAPWLKIYCAYLASRGVHVESATNAFKSCETLTSTRQLRKALKETNSLLTAALAFHFAGDASAVTGKAEDLRRACCQQVYNDVSDVKEMLSGTEPPPALLGVAGIGEEHAGDVLKLSRQEWAQQLQQEHGAPRFHAWDVPDDAVDMGGLSADAAAFVCLNYHAAAVTAFVNTACEDVRMAAKECMMFEEVSDLISVVYANRYGDAHKKIETPLWMRQLAHMGSLAQRVDPGMEMASAARRGSHLRPAMAASEATGGGGEVQGGEAVAPAAAASADVGVAGADGVGADAEESGGSGKGTRFGAGGADDLRGGGIGPAWKRGRSLTDLGGNTLGTLSLDGWGGGGSGGGGGGRPPPGTSVRPRPVRGWSAVVTKT